MALYTTHVINFIYLQTLYGCLLFSPITLMFRYVVVRVHHSWTEFQDYFKQQVFLCPNSGFRKGLHLLSLIASIYFWSYVAGREKEVAGFYQKRNCNSFSMFPFFLFSIHGIWFLIKIICHSRIFCFLLLFLYVIPISCLDITLCHFSILSFMLLLTTCSWAGNFEMSLSFLVNIAD